MEKKGFPANTMSQNRSFLRSEINVLIVFLAASIRLGEISSASMEREMSRTRRILCVVRFSTSRVTVYVGAMMRNMIDVTMAARIIQRIYIRSGIRLCSRMRGLGNLYPIRSRKNTHHTLRMMNVTITMMRYGFMMLVEGCCYAFIVYGLLFCREASSLVFMVLEFADDIRESRMLYIVCDFFCCVSSRMMWSIELF